MPFDSVDPKQSFPDLERGILTYWKEEDIFKRSMKNRKGAEVFSFYDGPPFATGLPHYGHLLAGTIKDVIPRYQTMRGKYVERRFGWDCHGLPIENLVEKEHDLTSKRDIEHMGVSHFNDHCRMAVNRYAAEWRTVVERMGRFVDMDFDYRTMDPEFMESIWWVFAELFKRGLIYEGHKPMHVCPRCTTPLSNFEVTQGYKDIPDTTVTAMFEVMSSEEDQQTFFLAWTTTPWTLPGNLFLAVHPETDYVTVASEGKQYILAASLVEQVMKKREYTIQKTQKGSELVGTHYRPLFSYFEHAYKETAFRVVAGDFVTTVDGTGIVHIAPGYGEDDYQVGKKEGVKLLQHVKMDGTFIREVTDFALKHAKPKEDHQSGDKMIAAHLKEKGLLFASENYTHSYPHCWRCDSPLLNFATSSWFVAVEKMKERMLESNKKTQWVPEHIRDGRFGNWLENARDWAISRNRFWGTPLPLWRNSMTGEVELVASRDAVMQKKPERFTKVIVMRHAESEGNVKGIYQGKEPGTPLTERGWLQAEEARDHILSMDGVKPSAIYHSPLQRTVQTAEVIEKGLKIEKVCDQRLREISFGDYEGQHINFDDLAFVRERRAHKLNTNKVETIYHFDGMETWQQSAERTHEFLRETIKKHPGETIVLVTHADIIMTIEQFFTGEDPQKIVHRPFPHLAGVHTFFFDHETGKAMDIHKDTVDTIRFTPAKIDPAMTVNLTVVRHGETDMNRERLIQGAELNPSLNEKGRAQAQEVATLLKNETFDVILVSPRLRATETAEIIRAECGYEKNLMTDDHFLERQFGVWSGKPIDDVMRTFGPKEPVPGLTPVWLRCSPEGGESLDEFLERVDRGLESILHQYAGKKVLLVAHGGIVRAIKHLQGESYTSVMKQETKNCEAYRTVLTPLMKKVPEVLDCWFESGSMPYAEKHFPYEKEKDVPPGFPADFIAEGLDQTRGWFYTLMVLSTGLFDCPPFRHCIVNGIVLAEDGKKMSKKLKNYPEPLEIVKKHGADAVRFALMMSPAVRGEDLRFSERCVTEVVRSLLLPLWNVYRLFVTYANASNFQPSIDGSLKNAISNHPLDQWVLLHTQKLVNTITHELESYDLSATCAELTASIDDLTNWYVRLSRKRFAGNADEGEVIDATDQNAALDTLYRVLLSHVKLLAPFCPFVTEAMYLNLTGEEHDSIHCADWPITAEISEEDHSSLETMNTMKTIVSLGLALRSDVKIRVRQPLKTVSIVVPPHVRTSLNASLLREELNCKQVIILENAESLGTPTLSVNARMVGPRLGGKVQDVIQAGKRGEYEENDDGFIILGETISREEASVLYHAKEGQMVKSERGVVVSIDTVLTDDLIHEGDARDVIHALQKARKESGLEFTDTIILSLEDDGYLTADDRQLIYATVRAVEGELHGGEIIHSDIPLQNERVIHASFIKHS